MPIFTCYQYLYEYLYMQLFMVSKYFEPLYCKPNESKVERVISHYIFFFKCLKRGVSGQPNSDIDEKGRGGLHYADNH